MPTADIKEVMNAPARKLRELPDDIRAVKYCAHCKEPMYRTPVLRCSHCGAVLPLRCYTYREGNLYYSECIDLNLIARGSTKDEAVGLLQEEIFTYLDIAIQGDGKGLVPRYSPLLRNL